MACMWFNVASHKESAVKYTAQKHLNIKTMSTSNKNTWLPLFTLSLPKKKKKKKKKNLEYQFSLQFKWDKNQALS